MKIQLTLEIKPTPKEKKKNPARPKSKPSISLNNNIKITHK